MNDESKAALSFIRSTYPALDGWRTRSGKQESPERGSELAGDTAIWPHHPPHEVARQSLVAALQHLNLARTAIEAGQLYPTSHFTVLRGALVGAAQAVWLLAPDATTERQQRALRVIHEWYHRNAQYHRAIDPVDLPDDPQGLELAEMIAFLEARRSEARQRWTDTPTLKAGDHLNLTKVIEWAANDTFPDPADVRTTRLLWKQMSGDAHALGWPAVTRPSTTWTSDRGGLSIGAASGDLPDVAQPYAASFKLLQRGWSLFDRRAEDRG